MSIDLILFSLFSLFSLLSSLFVISLRNAVHSVLFLVLTFFNIACLLLLMGAEFFSFLLIIVYVGAIAVLFLFVIMMLNIRLKTSVELRSTIIPFAFLFGFTFFNSFYAVLNSTDLLRFCPYNIELVSWLNETNVKTNTEIIGMLLYSHFSLLFLIAGLILLIAMIGAIILTLHYSVSSRKQIIEFQLIRNPKDSVKFFKLRS